MDEVSLKAFISVAKHQSFSKAADELALTQPAISKRIHNLEQNLNCVLFDRLHREIQLTELGKLFLERAKLIINTLNETKKDIKNFNQFPQGSLTIFSSYHVSLNYLKPIIQNFIKKYPQIDLHWHWIDSEAAITKIIDGEGDLALGTLPLNEQDKLIYHSFWQEKFVAVVAKHHPLAQENHIDIHTLKQYKALLLPLETATRTITQAQFLKANIDLYVEDAPYSLLALQSMIEAGLGWSVKPELLINEHLYALPLDNLGFIRHLGAIQHKQRHPSLAIQYFLKFIQDSR